MTQEPRATAEAGGDHPVHGGVAISVTMIAYNSERYVRAAIDSVLAQTCADWEILVVDNGSSDRTAEIVMSYADARIRYFRPPQALTLAECRNLAAREAHGEWLAFLDADDLWLPRKLELQLERVSSDASSSEVALVYARTASFSARGEEGETIFRYAGRDLPEGSILRALLLEGCIVPLVSAMVRRSAYWSVGGIPADYAFAEDYYLFAAVAERYRTLCVQATCCRYRVHPDSMTARLKTVSYKEALRILATWSKHLEPSEYRRRVAVYQTLIGVDAIVSHRKYGEGAARILRDGSLWFLLRGLGSTLFRRLVLRHRPIA